MDGERVADRRRCASSARPPLDLARGCLGGLGIAVGDEPARAFGQIAPRARMARPSTAPMAKPRRQPTLTGNRAGSSSTMVAAAPAAAPSQ